MEIEDIKMELSLEDIYKESDNQYDCCPLCGELWGDNPQNHICDKLSLVEQKRPRYYELDLDNYNEEFLKSIIRWQGLKLSVLTEPDKVDIKHIINFKI